MARTPKLVRRQRTRTDRTDVVASVTEAYHGTLNFLGIVYGPRASKRTRFGTLLGGRPNMHCSSSRMHCIDNHVLTDSVSMTEQDSISYEQANERLVQFLPELRDAYQRELEWWQAEAPGPHVLYDEILKPYINTLLASDRADADQ